MVATGGSSFTTSIIIGNNMLSAQNEDAPYPNNWTKGYFAFPPGTVSSARVPFSESQQDNTATTDATEDEDEDESRTQKRAKEQAWEERCRRDAEARQARLEREKAEALLGEMEWVRAGGMLRDIHGRRDVVRTEQLRVEVKKQDEEKRVSTMWDTYETRWKTVLASSSPVTFKDIPWPIPNASPSCPEEITLATVDEFLFASLNIRSNTVSKRDRIRSSILRWHPDKIASLFARVVPEEEDAVANGINTVFRCLKVLQDAEKQS